MTATTEVVNGALVITDTDGARDYVHPKTRERYVSVTTVGSSTSSKPWLQDWSAKLAAEFATDNLAALLALLGENKTGRGAVIDAIKGEAKRRRNLKADAGTFAHLVAEKLVLDGALPLLPPALADVDMDGITLHEFVEVVSDAFIQWFADYNPEVVMAEAVVFNPVLGVAGKLDLIILLRDVAIGAGGRLVPCPGNVLVLCVDIKTGKNLDVAIPEQLSAYRRMTEVALPQGEIGEMPKTHASAVLHLRPEHPNGYRFHLIAGADDTAAWNSFRDSVRLYRARQARRSKPGKVIYPLRPDGTVQPPLLADLDGEGYGRAPGALAKDETRGLLTLEDVAKLTAAQTLAVKGIGAKTLDDVRRMLADHGLHLADEDPAPQPAPATLVAVA
jgi:hypothetical protein